MKIIKSIILWYIKGCKDIYTSIKVWHENNRSIKVKDLKNLVLQFEDHKSTVQKYLDGYIIDVPTLSQFYQLKNRFDILSRANGKNKASLLRFKEIMESHNAFFNHLGLKLDEFIVKSNDNFKEVSNCIVKINKKNPDKEIETIKTKFKKLFDDKTKIIDDKFKDMAKSIECVYMHEDNMKSLDDKERQIHAIFSDYISELRGHQMAMQVTGEQFRKGMAIQAKSHVNEMNDVISSLNIKYGITD